MKPIYRTKRWGIRLACGILCGALLLPGFSAAALPGYSGGRLNVLGEGGVLPDTVAYCRYGEEADPAGMTWVDGRNGGKALLLDGKSETLRLGYDQLKLMQFSFAAWVNWLGPAEGQSEESAYSQRLFTIHRRTDNWLSVSPRARDTGKVKDGGYLDGLYLDYTFQDNADATHFEQFKPVQGGVSNGLPQNEWHHVAVVSDGQRMKLYVNGVLWFDDDFLMYVIDLKALAMLVGGGPWEGSYLHAMLQDVGLYEIALTGEQVAMLAADVDPLAEGAELPASSDPYIPTKPAGSAPASQAQAGDGGGMPTLFGIPVVAIYIIAGLVVVYMALSVVLSVRQKKRGGPPQPPGGKGGGRT